MKKRLFIALMAAMMVMAARAKTLIVYYSYTNNVHTIVNDLSAQIDADVVRVEPAEKGLDYAANNYAIGSALISAIRNNPNDAASYPDIDPVDVTMSHYNVVIVATPLWWSNMAAPMQSFLFKYGKLMAGKKIGLIVSSASSGISGVVADAHRLIADGDFLNDNLWIRSSQTSACHSMISNWLEQIDYNAIASGIHAVSSASEPTLRVSPEAISVEGEFSTLALYNLSGQKIAETSDRSIAASALAPGAYVTRVSGNGKMSSRKIVVAGK